MQDLGIDDQGRCEVESIIVETEDACSSFTGTYRKNIPLIIETYPLASEQEMASLLAISSTLNPLVGDKLQIYTSSINKHPEI
jgi:hypothetical protein